MSWLASTTRIPVIHPPGQVTTIRPDTEVDPRTVGLPADTPERIWKAVERLYASGFNPAISLCLRRDGHVLLDRGIGHSHGNAPDDPPGSPLRVVTPDTPYCIFSASKAITAMLIHHLDDKGLLHVGDRVCEYIPEFAQHGKDWVTVEHVLTHRAGIPSVGGEEDIELLLNPDAVVAQLCAAHPESAPGRRLAYHAISGGFILGEIVRRVTGKDIRTVLAEEFLDPLGFDGMNYGWHPDRLDEVAVNAFTGRRPGFPVSWIAKRALGLPIERAPAIANSRPWLTSTVPSGNIVSTANEASRFFQMLLQGGTLDGTRVMDARTIHRARRESAYLEMDFTVMLPVRYGVGLMLGSRHVGLFGPRTQNAFGHLGFTNVFCWADPDRGLAGALFTSGKPLLSRHIVPLAQLMTTISRACPPRG